MLCQRIIRIFWGCLFLFLLCSEGALAQIPDTVATAIQDTTKRSNLPLKLDSSNVKTLYDNSNPLFIRPLDTLTRPSWVLYPDTLTPEWDSWMAVIKADTGSPYRRVQMVSIDTYDYFPKEELNRFNSHAPFFYDGNDLRVKSVIYEKEEDIPQVYYLRDKVDTAYFYLDEVLTESAIQSRKNLVFEIERTRMDGDLADYLVRLAYRKNFDQFEESIRVTISDVDNNSIANIKAKLKLFRIVPEEISPLDLLKKTNH